MSEDAQRAVAAEFDPNRLDAAFYENPYPVYGALRSFDMVKYKRRRSDLTVSEATSWEIRYQIGAVLYAIALGAQSLGLRREQDHVCAGDHDGPDLSSSDAVAA